MPDGSLAGAAGSNGGAISREETNLEAKSSGVFGTLKALMVGDSWWRPRRGSGWRGRSLAWRFPTFLSSWCWWCSPRAPGLMMLLADRWGEAEMGQGHQSGGLNLGHSRLPLRSKGHVFPSSGSRCFPHSLFEKARFICDSAVRSRACDSCHGIIFPVFPFVPSLFRLIPHLPVLENIFFFFFLFFFFFAEDRITHRDGKDHFCLSSVAHPPSVPNHPHLVFLPPPQDCAAQVWSFLVFFFYTFWVCIFLMLFYIFATLKKILLFIFGCAGSSWPRELFSNCVGQGRL